MRRRFLTCARRIAIGATLVVLAGFAASTLAADTAQARPLTDKPHYTDAEIIDGFFKVAFGAEYRLSGRSDRIRKYVAPVRIAIDGDASRRRRTELTRIIADIGRHIRHLDIALATEPAQANMTVTLVRDRDLHRTIARRFGPEHARAMRRRLDPQCLSGFRKNDRFEIERSEAILPVDADRTIFRSCAYEELLQALGPINDTDTVPWTTFNDDVRATAFGVYDQLLLNILYDPRIKPGMTADEVRAVLPDVLPDVRAFVSSLPLLPRKRGRD